MEITNFGAFLRDERERRNISLADIAEKTKISISALKLIESGKLENLPSEVFIRGFIRAYAQVLNMSSSEPLGLLDHAFANQRRDVESPRAIKVSKAWQPPFPSPEEVAKVDEDQPAKHGIGLAVFVIIVLLIATITLSLFVRQQPQSGEGLSSEETPHITLLSDV